jgi:hypothetical protein
MAAVTQWRVQLYRDGTHVGDVFPRYLGRAIEVPRPWRLGEPFTSDIYELVSCDQHAGIIRADFKELRIE